MTDTTHHLCAVWDSLCPAKDQGFIPKLIGEMLRDGDTDRTRHMTVAVGRLYDGLAYGNWPSTLHDNK